MHNEIHVLIISVYTFQQHTEKDLSFLSPVPNDYFVTEVVEVGISLEEFQKKRELAKKKLNIFLELAQLQLRPNKIRDVLLMENKVIIVL